MPDVEWLGSALEEFLVIEAETASDALKAVEGVSSYPERPMWCTRLRLEPAGGFEHSVCC